MITVEEGDTSGIACRKCGSRETTVFQTRRGPDVIWRRRACKQCGAKTDTKEKVNEARWKNQQQG
jgi:transcriptional regulator NrdR family protein